MFICPAVRVRTVLSCTVYVTSVKSYYFYPLEERPSVKDDEKIFLAFHKALHKTKTTSYYNNKMEKNKKKQATLCIFLFSIIHNEFHIIEIHANNQ